ncbi:MAG: hypothetical protein U0324_24395 [Polyangiales bacterium]
MRALDARDMLRLWETCATLHPIDRALAVLRVGAPGRPPEELAALPVGERERLAVALRVRTFGERAEGACDCPACGEAHEVDPPLDAMLAAPAPPPEPVTLRIGSYEATVRLPDSVDQACAASCDDGSTALRTLLERCVGSASHDGASVAPADLPEDVVAAVAEALAALDANAETLVDLVCVRCGQTWTVVFDAGEFLWREVAARAQRLLYEVHVLARAYGWAEGDILALSAGRREAYLDRVGA